MSDKKTEQIFKRLFKLGLLESPTPPEETKSWREVFPDTPPCEIDVEETIAFLRGRGDEEEDE